MILKQVRTENTVKLFIYQVVPVLVFMDKVAIFRVPQTVRRGDLTSTHVTVWDVYRVIMDVFVIKVCFLLYLGLYTSCDFDLCKDCIRFENHVKGRHGVCFALK